MLRLCRAPTCRRATLQVAAQLCVPDDTGKPRNQVGWQHHLADDPQKPYDQAKIERLVPDYDDIRDKNDVQHTVTDVREAGELGDEVKDGGVGAAASALAGDVVGAGRIACEIAAGGVQGVGKVAAAVCGSASQRKCVYIHNNRLHTAWLT